MKRSLTMLAALSLLAGSGTAFAQDNRDNHDNRGAAMQGPSMHGPSMAGPSMSMQGMKMDHHADWKQGGHIAKEDWGRGHAVDYRQHHLKRPPRGYQWREVDGNYLLAAAATGLIASIIMTSH